MQCINFTSDIVLAKTSIHFVGEVKRHSHEHVLHEAVRYVPHVCGLVPAYVGISSYHRFAVCWTELKHAEDTYAHPILTPLLTILIHGSHASLEFKAGLGILNTHSL